MEFKALEKAVKKYPQHKGLIVSAYSEVMAYPEKDLGLELSKIEIDEKTLWDMIGEINKNLMSESMKDLEWEETYDPHIDEYELLE